MFLAGTSRMRFRARVPPKIRGRFRSEGRMRREAQLLCYEVPYFEISGEEGMAGDGQRPIADGTTTWGGATQTSVDCELNQRRRRTQLRGPTTSKRRNKRKRIVRWNTRPLTRPLTTSLPCPLTASSVITHASHPHGCLRCSLDRLRRTASLTLGLTSTIRTIYL